ncbi:secretin and TonB N-terminal domain-containing protein [Sulfuriferula thiophila]|uniref:secretin and TonB N-terminal domain-containing protein n=1 Tax=Sulfuriferula thiophila TaxID=1781211 RepID=UPI000F606042|nr:secretin and TonB N-terminal domain-containing protein [Sulfuriferula thiophila]
MTQLAGCAGEKAYREGNQQLRNGNIEEGLAQLEAATKAEPNNLEYRTSLHRQREMQIYYLLGQADSLVMAGNYNDAEATYQRVLKIEPANQRASDGLTHIKNIQTQNSAIAKAKKYFEAGNFDAALSLLQPILNDNPNQIDAKALQQRVRDKQTQTSTTANSLKSTIKKPITLEFRDANMRSIFEVISRTANINFIFDKDVSPNLKSTLYVKNTTIEEAINLLLVTNQLEKRVLNENTILIYPNTPAKLKDYQELTVKSFYLANADVKQTMNMIKTMLKTRDIFIDEKLNLLMMRDTPEVIRLAEKLIAAQDMAEPEVILDVEILEVKRSKLSELGIQYPNQFTVLNPSTLPATTTSSASGTLVVNTTSTNAPLTLANLAGLTTSSIGISNPALNLRKENSDTSLLANPRIRVRNREKAKIHIGEKVPVITTTSTMNVGLSQSVSYLDIGLKLDVEPNIYLDNEVGMKVGLEVSNIVREIQGANGSLTYQVGTRNAATVLRLKDGETQALAGLINDEDRASANKIPGLGEIPLLGRLFSTHHDEKTKTEIILLITPHIVRNLVKPDAEITEFTSGTDTTIGAPSLRLTPTLSTPLPKIDNPQLTPPTQQPATISPQTQPVPQPAFQPLAAPSATPAPQTAPPPITPPSSIPEKAGVIQTNSVSQTTLDAPVTSTPSSESLPPAATVSP